MKKILLLSLILLIIIVSFYGCSGVSLEGKVAVVKSSYELNSGNKEFRILLGRTYVTFAMKEEDPIIKNKWFQKAVEEDTGYESNDDGFTYIIKRDTTDVDASIYLADAYIRWGDSLKSEEDKLEKYSEAKTILIDLLEYKDEPRILYELARIEAKVHNKEGFTKYYRKAEGKDKNLDEIDDYTAGEIAEYLRTESRFDAERAEKLLINVNNKGSREPKLHYELALLYIYFEKLVDAEKELIKARDFAHFKSLDPNKPGPLMYADNKLISLIVNSLGEIYLKYANKIEGSTKEEFEKKSELLEIAKDHFYQSVLYNKNNIEPHINLGNIFYSDLTEPNRREKIESAIVNLIYAVGRIEAKYTKEDKVYNINDIIEDKTIKFSSNIETSLFYKLGYLYYLTAVEYAYEKGAKEISQTFETLRNCFYLSFSKGEYVERKNPNLNFALGNAFYHSKMYKNSLNYFSNIISYYEPILKEKYKAKKDTDPNKRTVHFELAKAYNNRGAAYFSLYIKTNKKNHFISAQRDFLQGQVYYYSYNRVINNPKSSNLKNIFAGKNINLANSDGQVFEEPLIYDELNIDMDDYIKF